MKQKWEEAKNRLDELERIGRLVWKKVSTKDLEIIIANLHLKEKDRWSEPALFELERRRYLRLKIIGVLTLIAAIIAIIIGKV
jgi:type IV secretory pathway component VirB8